MVSPATVPETNDINNNKPEKADSISIGTSSEKEPSKDAFEALLSSQRGILAQMNFGNNSNPELQFTEGPDNLAIVSPNSSTQFEYTNGNSNSNNNSYSRGFDYDYECGQYPSSNGYHPRSGEYYYQDSLNKIPRHYGKNNHRHHSSIGLGDDRFILDHITIGPGNNYCNVFDDEVEDRMRRKRETEQELVEVVRRKKRQRRGSYRASISFDSFQPVDEQQEQEPTIETTQFDDLLPCPADLMNLDDASTANSLLLEDLDEFLNADPDAILLSEDEVIREITKEDSNQEEEPVPEKKEEIKEDTARKTDLMETGSDHQPMETSAPTDAASSEGKKSRRRSSSGTSKAKRPLRRTVTDETDTEGPKTEEKDQRSLWKPRRGSTSPSNTKGLGDSCVSLHIEDLENPKRSVSRTSSSQSQQKTLHVSIMDRDDMSVDPSTPRTSLSAARPRSSSSSSPVTTPTVRALSAALSKSLGSTKSIQEWDRKMGLKRSHSQTMRLSSKSREQLLAFLIQQEKEQKEAAAAQEQQQQDAGAKSSTTPSEEESNQADQVASKATAMEC